jgi:hypothetical protein
LASKELQRKDLMVTDWGELTDARAKEGHAIKAVDRGG